MFSYEKNPYIIRSLYCTASHTQSMLEWISEKLQVLLKSCPVATISHPSMKLPLQNDDNATQHKQHMRDLLPAIICIDTQCVVWQNSSWKLNRKGEEEFCFFAFLIRSFFFLCILSKFVQFVQSLIASFVSHTILWCNSNTIASSPPWKYQAKNSVLFQDIVWTRFTVQHFLC